MNEVTAMKILAMHKVDATMESGAPVPMAIVEGMGKLIGQMAQKGVFVGGEGLRPSKTRARVSVSRGARKVERGPYGGRTELIAGFCLFRAASLDEAIDWSGRIAQALGDGVEVEVGPVTEPWDLGMPAPTPKPTPRFLALAKSDAKAEAGAAFLPRIAGPVAELQQAGALISAEGLAPSAQSKRLFQRRDRRDIVDGPFAESKELIAGFSVMNVASWDEAFVWLEKFAAVLGGEVEMDLRLVG